ncbi:epsin-2-like protein [Dinothrombium tinctorium]|uniref:Epsin-2-like protein n=1 Tax=Dinothrombium tinctorium TaxID=1965070 RepID=A0A3S3PBM1_9ACAR|nr:epsin-2-like protein [Dinothrombium tinctorium]
MMNVRGIQRNVKNVVRNYSEAQVKVREATSNDPWGPSSTLMSEIADLTYNVVAFSEIMQMIWKRLNDHGKNWRHVYKALVLLEYLIKTGSEKVAQQCKENIFAIQTLKDFQHNEENKDPGLSVREKSKALVALLKDDEKMKSERAKALKAKERFAQSVSYMSNSPSTETLPKTSASYHESLSSAIDSSSKPITSDLENARPQTLGEEELQLQLALAMSKEEAEQEERMRKNDDLRLQLALSESQKNAKLKPEKKSAMDDLLSLNIGPTPKPTDPWGAPSNGDQDVLFNSNLTNSVSGGATNDPWSPSPTRMTPKNDPWKANSVRSSSATNDPWQPSPKSITPVANDPWSPGHCDNAAAAASPVDSNMFHLGNNDASSSISTNNIATRKTPESFLGPNSNLVNLEALVSTKTGLPAGGNPFASSSVSTSNPFQTAKPPPPTINQLRSQNQFAVGVESSSLHQSSGQFHQPNTFAPLMPSNFTSINSSSTGNNPFAM